MRGNERLSSVPDFGVGVGHARMAKLLGALPDPAWMTGLDAIRVTGSNGKGSVCAMVESILRAAGLRTGLFTSPHLRRFTERIRVGSEEIGAQALDEALDWVEAVGAERCGGFEIVTAAAMKHFWDHRVDAAVIEAGIGGRHDSTRAIPGRVVGLSSVDLEHQNLLGDTTGAIARDKADLCAAGGVLICGPLERELIDTLERHCASRELRMLEARAVVECELHEMRLSGSRLDLRVGDVQLSDVKLSLAGPHQVDNAILAVALVDAWGLKQRVGEPAFARALRVGLASVTWPGRLEQVGEDPQVIVDVGHTPAAARALVESLDCLSVGPVVLVLGVSKGKAAAQMVPDLVELAAEVVCTRAAHNGRPAEEIAALVRGGGLAGETGVVKIPRVAEAMDHARARARALGLPVLVAGGLFLAVEATEPR